MISSFILAIVLATSVPATQPSTCKKITPLVKSMMYGGAIRARSRIKELLTQYNTTVVKCALTRTMNGFFSIHQQEVNKVGGDAHVRAYARAGMVLKEIEEYGTLK